MPKKRGLLLPREGLYADPIFTFLGRTILNPAFLAPLIVLAKLTKTGMSLKATHPRTFDRFLVLFYVALALALNKWLSRKVLNNWVDDEYKWCKEIVVITGGAGGIGGEMVKLLSRRGITVVVLDIQPLTFQPATNVHYFECDIASPEKLAAAAKEIRERVGHPTILINNAGVVRGRTLLDSTPTDIKFTFDVNTLAHYWTTKEFLPHMVGNNHGMVVTISSYASFLCVPNMVDYGASKSATMAFHEGLTAELFTRYNAPKVRTILVNPGYSRTALFQGYEQGSPFLMPPMEPETVAERVVEKILTGTSGQVIVPKAGALLTALRALPDWYQIQLRAQGAMLMKEWTGRQVVKDVNQYYSEKDKCRSAGPESSAILVSVESKEYGPEESTVLVSEGSEET